MILYRRAGGGGFEEIIFERQCSCRHTWTQTHNLTITCFSFTDSCLTVTNTIVEKDISRMVNQ